MNWRNELDKYEDSDIDGKINESFDVDVKRRNPKRVRNAHHNSAFLSLSQVLERVPIGRSTLYLMVKKGEFPKQIKLSERVAVWSKAEVEEWIENKLKRK